MTVYEQLLETIKRKGAAYVILVDPDKIENKEEQLQMCQEAGVDAIFVGGSILLTNKISAVVKRIKSLVSVPVILFPGDAAQLVPEVDAVLFISLISGRNPQYLIEEHVRSAGRIREYGLETIPTGYMLIESGATSAVEFVSKTSPIPRDKIDIAVAHGLAAQYLGMKLIYLEAGSGAKKSVPEDMIKAVSGSCHIPVIVGGGIRTPEVAYSKVQNGAKIIVTGNVLERDTGTGLIKEFCNAIHIR